MITTMERRVGVRERKTVHAQVVEEVRQLILAGELKPGDRLRIDELARRLGVSAMPVREALHQLTAEGTITLDPYRGFSVSALTAEEAADLYATRAQLEGFAARQAVPRLDPQALTQLRQAAAQMAAAESAHDPARFLEGDRAFHRVLYANLERPILLRHIASLMESSVRYTRAHLPLPSAMARALEEHGAILAACERRDAELAELLMRRHTEAAASRIIDWLNSCSAEPANRGVEASTAGPTGGERAARGTTALRVGRR
jgi:DNA-binding GntR family transcriptional regulator